jgi:hypothetical protein
MQETAIQHGKKCFPSWPKHLKKDDDRNSTMSSRHLGQNPPDDLNSTRSSRVLGRRESIKSTSVSGQKPPLSPTPRKAPTYTYDVVPINSLQLGGVGGRLAENEPEFDMQSYEDSLPGSTLSSFTSSLPESLPKSKARPQSIAQKIQAFWDQETVTEGSFTRFIYEDDEEGDETGSSSSFYTEESIEDSLTNVSRGGLPKSLPLGRKATRDVPDQESVSNFSDTVRSVDGSGRSIAQSSLPDSLPTGRRNTRANIRPASDFVSSLSDTYEDGETASRYTTYTSGWFTLASLDPV